MLYSAFFPLITAFYFLLIGILLVGFKNGSENKKSQGRVAFFLLCLTTFVWQFSWALIFSVKNPNIASYLVKQGYLPILFLPTTMYHFLIMISQSWKKEKNYLILSYGTAAIFAILLLTSNLVTDGYYTYSFGFYPKAGALHFLHVLQTFIVALRGLQIAYEKQKTVSGEYQEQLRLCCLSLTIYLFAALDYLCNYGYAFYPPGIFFIGTALTIMAYALAKKNLLNVQWVISRWLSHVVLITAIALIVVAISIAPLATWLKTIIYACFCIGLAKWGETLRSNIQTSTEKKWISDWYDANSLTHELAKALAQSLTPTAIIQAATQTINAHMNFKKVYTLTKKPQGLFLSKQQPTLFAKNSLAMPVFSSEKMEAILIFDSFISERTFNSADIHCFTTLMAQLDLAMHKAITHQNMTNELQQKNIHLAEANNKLQDLDKRKNEFLANTSHELRTPLHGIMGMTQYLLKILQHEVSSDQLENLQLIHHSGTRLNYLINDILDFSKMRDNNVELMLTEVNIPLLMKNLLVLLTPQMTHQNLVLINELPDDLPKVLADENRMQQILYNLLGNALKFTPRGFIRIYAEVEHGFLKLFIADTGIGIPSHKLDLIFDAFEQVDGSKSRKYGGSGLGLSVTKKLVELHQGAIGVKSSIGSGSCFHFSVPLAEGAAVSDYSHRSPTMQFIESPLPECIAGKINPHMQRSFPHLQLLPKATVLVVDDDGLNIRVTKNFLTSIGATVITANSGKAALALLHDLVGRNKLRPYHPEIPDLTMPDLILLDVMMPDMNGYEVATAIRATISKTLPIVILTALKEDTEALHQGFIAGVNDFLSKPYDETELFMRLESVLHSQTFLKAQRKTAELA